MDVDREGRSLSIYHARREEFLERYLGDLPGGGAFVPTAERFEIGQRISLCFQFPEIPDGLSVHGSVAWRRTPVPWRSVMLPGIGVAFGSEQRSRVEFLLDFCRGYLSDLRKPGRRIPTQMRADILTGEARLEALVRDISHGGVFVHTPAPLAPGAAIDLELFVRPDDPPERLSGRVAWSRIEGDEPGMGVQFDFQSAARKRRFAAYVDALALLLSSDAHVSR
jgi:type IV pilus assembly protein PilZ